MEVVSERVCGVDVGKAILAATVRVPAEGGPSRRREETKKFATFADDLNRLAEWLMSEGVSQVAMEATGDYWRPVWWVLEQAGFDLVLARTRRPSRSTRRRSPPGTDPFRPPCDGFSNTRHHR